MLQPYASFLLLLPLCAGTQLSASPPQEPPVEKVQEKKKSARERLREKRAARTQLQANTPQLLRPDGSLVLPGEIPPATTAASRSSWQALTESLGGLRRMQSFQLFFELRQKSKDKPQSNDISVVFAYLANPGYLRARLESGRELLRGPAGDFLIDHEEVIALVGREGVEDRKQLDSMAAIAASFVGLTDPLSLRLVELELIDAPSLAPPARFGPKELKGLTWIRIASPDFYLQTANEPTQSGQPRIYSAELGLHTESMSIRFAIIADTGLAPASAPATMLVHMSKHQMRGRRLVPHVLEIFELDHVASPPVFHSTPTSKLWLNRKSGKLGASLRAEDFLPPDL